MYSNSIPFFVRQRDCFATPLKREVILLSRKYDNNIAKYTINEATNITTHYIIRDYATTKFMYKNLKLISLEEPFINHQITIGYRRLPELQLPLINNYM